MATFSNGAYAVPTMYNYVSTYDLHKPQYADKFVERYGDQDLVELIGKMGKTVPVSGLEYKHIEGDRIMPKVIASVVGSSTQGTFTINPNNSTQNAAWSQASPYVGAAQTSQGMPVVKGNTILIKPASGAVNADTYQWAIVWSVNASAGTFVAYTVDGSTITTDSTPREIMIFGNAHGEGSGLPASLSSKTTTYTNNLQIIKDSFRISKSEKNVMTWIPFTDENGKSAPMWYLNEEKNLYRRHMNNRELSLLLGRNISNTVLSDLYSGTDNTPIATTNGLIPEVLANGINNTYSSISGWTVADGYNLVKSLDKENGSYENLLMVGIDLSIDIDTEMKNTFQNGGVQFNAFGGKSEQAVKFGFDSFKLSNYTFHKKVYKAMNDVQTMGAVGYTFPSEGIVIPMDKQYDYSSKAMADSLRIRYSQAPDGSESRLMKHTVRDLNAITGDDVYACDYLSQIGFELFAANRFAYIMKG